MKYIRSKVLTDPVAIERQLIVTSLPKKFLMLVCDLIGVDGPGSPIVLRPPQSIICDLDNCMFDK